VEIQKSRYRETHKKFYGWIVATSNEIPDWLEDKPMKKEDSKNWEKNCGAWKR
jgi:hypothetical protein